METFNPPLFQTWLMFLGMSFALPAHYLSEWYRHKKAETDPATAAELAKENKALKARINRLDEQVAWICNGPYLRIPSWGSAESRTD